MNRILLALLSMAMLAANSIAAPSVEPYILTPPAPATPRINGASVFGVRPGSPFLFTVAATGDRPMTFSAQNLPEGLTLDPATGRITGALAMKGEHVVMLGAKNSLGEAEKKFRIVCGDQIALTPPMGWNSWNCFAGEVSADRVKAAADVLVKSGLANHGWTYVNIDDGWQNNRDSQDPTVQGPHRDADGFIVPNARFPDMKGLVDYIHGLGLKVGLYSSPGPWTCGGHVGSYGYERQDAETYAKWEIDYFKYDWCSYGGIADGMAATDKNISSWAAGEKGKSDVEVAAHPFRLMGKLLREQKRDIVYSVCQYGLAEVWKWGASVDGNAWRTTWDIVDTWESMSSIGFDQQDHAAPFAKPGNWNDPDMLVLGHVGWGNPKPTRLTPDEQYTHMSLWCLLASPLLLGCDLEKLDDFTLSLLTNDEVIAVDQDPLGKQATCVIKDGDLRVYVRELEDGSRAVGFFNLGVKPMELSFKDFSKLALAGKQTPRDLWRQKNLAAVDTSVDSLPLTIPAHGVVLHKFTPVLAQKEEGLHTADPAPVVHDGVTVWLHDLDISQITQGWGNTAGKNASVGGNPLKIAGRAYERGVGTHAVSSMEIQLDGTAYEFAAQVGVDDEVEGLVSNVEFIVIGDGKELWRSGVMKTGDSARDCRVDLAGVKLLELQVSDGGNGTDFDHANWAEARFRAPTGARLHTVATPVVVPYILTPPAPATPRINGAPIFGVRPGSPFLYTVPATGDRPMRFSADGLPDGIKIDGASGRITGRMTKLGTYEVTLRAENAKGNASKRFRIVCGDQIALTPPMGWNSWNCFAREVSADKVKRAADVFVRSGLINHGWSYVNIDEFWQNNRNGYAPELTGDYRDQHGVIVPNKRFPDMKGLVDYIHDLGLKVGIYSSPGPWTCDGCAGSYGYERLDAETYAKWGIDYLKYDWCSYGGVDSGQKVDLKTLPSFNIGQGERDREAAIAPYHLMGALLREQPRDIVYSLCQYGMSDVASWGGSVNGNTWRTTFDIIDTWNSVWSIALTQDKSAAHAGPGRWNDPDMLVLGHVGWGDPHPTRLTPDEQYLHMSLWSLFSAPLLLGCDLEELDDFTLSLLTNDEVIAINQDALGCQATCVQAFDKIRVYVKELEDGSRAVGFCNFGTRPAVMRYDAFAPLGLKGRQQARDLWRQKDVATVDTARESLPLTIPAHGIVLYKFTSMP